MYQYSISELSSNKALVRALHTTGATVVFELYDSTDTLVPLTSTACTEIGTSGVFVFDLNNITTKPTVLENYQGFFKEGATVVGYVEARAGGWVETSTTGANLLTITAEDGLTNPIPDVGIVIWDETQSIVIGTGKTIANGTAQFNLEAGNYVATLAKNQVNFDVDYPFTILAGSNTETFAGEPLTVQPPIDATLCRLYAFARGQDSKSISDFKGTAKVVRDTAINGAYLYKLHVEASREISTGEFYWIIPQGVTVEVQGLTHFERRTVVVPNTATAELPDLPNA